MGIVGIDNHGKVDWKRITEVDFNRIVEAVVLRDAAQHGLEAFAIDGRGGDGGIDIEVRRGGKTVHVYQLKYFPEGFSGGWRQTRRAQILGSFRTAAPVGHSDWTLVVPCNGTVLERKYLTGLASGTEIRTHFMGVAELDNLLATHADLGRWATREPVVELMRTMSLEQAALASPEDLQKRVRSLTEIVDERSPYWGINFGSAGGTVFQEVYAKRPDAQEKEPIRIGMETTFNAEQGKLFDQFRSVMRFGGSQPVELPAGVVTRFTIDGPEWIAMDDRSKAAEYVIQAVAIEDALGQQVELQQLDDDGDTVGVFRGQVAHLSRGDAGLSLSAVFPGGAELEWLLPDDVKCSGKITISLDYKGCSASDSLRAAQLVEMLHSGAPMAVSMSMAPLFQVARTEVTVAADIGSPEGRQLLEDLAVLERELGLIFELPEQISPADRRLIRVYRMILEGFVAIMPGVRSGTVTLNGHVDDGIAAALDKPGAQYVEYPRFKAMILGQQVVIGRVTIYISAVSADDGATHLAALRAGTGAGRKVTFTPVDAAPFQIYMPARLRGTHVVPSPWNVIGVSEHPALEKLLAPGLPAAVMTRVETRAS
jgi:hypothetical protein